MIFFWEGINPHGEHCQNTIESSDINAASKTLNQQNIILLKITPQSQQKNASNINTHAPTTPSKQKIKPQQLAEFMQQLSFLINSHLPLVTAINTIAKDSPYPGMRALLETIRHDIETGSTLTKALRQHPRYFTELWCNLIHTGEKSGTLDAMLRHIAAHIGNVTKQKRKVIKALLYPITVLGIGIIVSAILLAFVIPQFQEMFANFGAMLPAYTQFIIHLSRLIKNYGLYLLALGSAVSMIFCIARKRSPPFAHKVDTLMLRLPWYGALLHKSIITDFARILHITIKAGLPLLDALAITTSNINNWRYQQGLVEIEQAITRGQSLYSALRMQKLFPERMLQLIALGEESGNLDNMLDAIARFYEEEINYVIDNLNNLLEPLLMLILGVLVGGLIVGIYLPIFQLGNVI